MTAVFGMQAPGDTMTQSPRRLESLIDSGLVAGVVSALAAAGLLALGGVVAGVGAVVPFYAIVAVVDPSALAQARGELAQGLDPTFYQPQFVGGFGVCLVLGALSGIVFALGIRNHTIRGVGRYVLGAAHGIVMMCLFYLGALQIIGTLAGVESDAMSLSGVVGWPALVVAHAAHGVVLAWALDTRLARTGNVFAQNRDVRNGSG